MLITKEIITKAWDELDRVIKKYGLKPSIMFADENNKPRFPEEILHIMVEDLGGYHKIDKILEGKDKGYFEKMYRHYWENFKNYRKAPHCKGRNELINGTFSRLINAKTGKNIFSDGTSIKR